MTLFKTLCQRIESTLYYDIDKAGALWIFQRLKFVCSFT